MRERERLYWLEGMYGAYETLAAPPQRDFTKCKVLGISVKADSNNKKLLSFDKK